MTSLSHEHSLIDELLADQQRLYTPVADFSRWHEKHDGQPELAPHYSRLIPLAKPAPGEQYAFEVNLDQCTGCKACVTACHSLNGLDEDESWRDVGQLVGSPAESYQQTITTACHHCQEPACAEGCPVLAYEKDEDTGIVRHLDDQCIGCSYCVLKCPYDVPKYNAKRGIVRKCDMCHSRLAEGEAPACVQACPNGAIAIRVVKREDAKAQTALYGTRIVPSAVSSDYTHPTTRYLSTKEWPASAQAADMGTIRVEEAHTPLAIMLALTQIGTGSLMAGALMESKLWLWIGAVTAIVGMQASVLHLGQPLKAWRIFLGWKKSWLSREAMTFGLYASAAIGAALGLVPAWVAVIIGLIAVFTSVMVYVDTRRPMWGWSQTGTKFYGTTLIATSYGLAVAWPQPWTLMLAGVLTAAKLGWEILFLQSQTGALSDPVTRSARLLIGPLRYWWAGRVLLGIIAVLTLPASPALAFGLWAAGEIIERSLFFRAGVAWRMPGN
jgi:formate dehydrogenase iron-sulfur subunit